MNEQEGEAPAEPLLPFDQRPRMTADRRGWRTDPGPKPKGGCSVPNGHDREWVRLCLTIDGFRARHRRWPTRVRIDPKSLATIRDEILTPESFTAVAEKLELVPEKDARFIAEDSDGRRFSYGEDMREGKPDIQAEEWLGPVMHRESDDDPMEGMKIWDAAGNLVYPKIEPSSVRYIKLGRKGIFEEECTKNGTIRLGFGTESAERFPLCIESRWDDLNSSFLAAGRDQGTATNFTNQVRRFFEDDGTTLWITFIGDRLHWGFLEPAPAKRHESGTGVIRIVKGGWRSTDINCEPLTKDRLSGALTKLAAYQGASCDVDVADYVIRRIKGQKTPEVEQAIAALEEMKKCVLGMIRLLGPKDFEILVDLVFSTSGWRRQGVIGKTTKTLDLDIILPSTGERAFVQVKSKTNSKELAEYVRQFEELNTFNRMFFVFHSGKAETDAERVTVIGPEKLAEMAIDAGLVNWLIRKVS